MNKGIALIDLLIGIMISLIVIGGMCGIMALVFADNSFLLQWSSATHNVDTALNMIDTDARGVVYLNPPEDLLAAGDSHYIGISSIPNASRPAPCENTNNSVIRITYGDRLLPVGKTDRAWAETSITTTPLIVDLTPPGPFLFSGATFPKSIIVVDAYDFFARRYLVTGVIYSINTHLNPETGLVDLGTYSYANVSLAMPPYLAGTNAPQSGVDMVTGSFVFGAHTSTFCLAAVDGSLIQIDEQSGVVTPLVPNPDGDYQIQSAVAGSPAFVASYYNTQVGQRVDPTFFFTDMVSAARYNCVDSLFLSLTLTPTPTALEKFRQGHIPQDETTITRTQGAFMTNLQVGRPASCP